MPLTFRGGTGRAKGVFLFLSGWIEFAFFRISEFGTVNVAQPGSLLHLNKTIGIKPLVSCITLQETPDWSLFPGMPAADAVVCHMREMV